MTRIAAMLREEGLRGGGRMRGLLVLLAVVCAGTPLLADMVFPARLELRESAPGVFDVRFNLPVQNGKRIKATPVLPPVCEELAPPQETSDDRGYAMAWQVRCAPEALPGQSLGVDGLLGSQTDVLLSIETRDGRRYGAVLKPARARYVVPSPPDLWQVARSEGRGAMRACLLRAELILLLGLAVLAGRSAWRVAAAVVAGAVAYGAGLALAGANFLLIPGGLPVVLVLGGCVMVAGRLAAVDAGRVAGLPGWLVAVLAGVLYGGAVAGFKAAPEFSLHEARMALVAHAAGVLAGMLLVVLLWVELRRGLAVLPALRDPARRRRVLAVLVGIAATAILVRWLSAWSLLPSLAPTAPAVVFVMAMVLGVHAGRRERPIVWLPVALLLAAGLVTGGLGFDLPFGRVVEPLCLFALGAALGTRQDWPVRVLVPALALGAFYPAVAAGAFLEENLSKPVAQVAGNGVLVLVLFLAGWVLNAWCGTRRAWVVRLAGGIGAVWALWVWGSGLLDWFRAVVVSDHAMGFIRIPLLSLGLLGAALLVRPRRSRIRAQLGAADRGRLAHRALAVAAIFVVSAGTLRVANPWFAADDAPAARQAGHILQGLLTNTYQAFNLEDENALFARLAENVGDDLVEDLYLDSRRRLKSGLREGSEVTVKDVAMAEVGPPVAGGPGAFRYDCAWTVTARVRHLQHVHHRRNKYTGTLEIRVVDGRWKIEGVDLKSEDRTVIAGQPA